MPAVTIRNLSAETHSAPKVRAEQRGRSLEAEIRRILETAATPPERAKLGSLLAEIGREARLGEGDWDVFEAALKRDIALADPMTFDG